MRNIFLTTASAVLLLTLPSCLKDVNISTDPEDSEVTVSMDFRCPATRSILGGPEEIENKLSNVLIMLYRTSDGMLDKSFFVTSGSTSISLLAGINYDIYCLANIDGENSVTVPMTESEARNLSYRIPAYGRIASLGLPSAAVIHNYSATAASTLPVCLERLVAKIEVCINADGLSAGQDDVFRNVKLYIRNANSVISPFLPSGSRARSSSDIIQLSDYDPEMKSTDDDTYIFYVPENMQGDLLKGNVDASLKTESSLTDAGVDPSLVTYVEFTGHLNSEKAGYGGDLLYRFYLGEDDLENFDICRNRLYRIDLNLSTKNLHSPYWKISHGEDWSDDRVLYLTSTGGDILPDGQVLAVRANRPAELCIFVNGDGGSLNRFSLDGKSSYADDQNISGVNVINWTSNVISSDPEALDLPDLMALEGLSVDVDEQGTMTVSVSDESKLCIGEEYEISVMLVPGREEHNRSVRIKVLPNCNTTSSQDADNFYLAQKYSLSLSGLMGNTLSISDNNNGKSLEFDRSTVSVTDMCASFNAYGILPGESVVKIVSDDTLNDPTLLIPLTVKKPYPAFRSQTGPVSSKSVTLLFDGQAEEMGFAYFDSSSSSATEMTRDMFESDYYDRLLAPSVKHSADGGPSDPAAHFTADLQKDSVYVQNIVSGSTTLWTWRTSSSCMDKVMVGPMSSSAYGQSELPCLNLYLKNPFPGYQSSPPNLGTFRYDGCSEEGLSGHSLSFTVGLNASLSNVTIGYDGLMKPRYSFKKTSGNYYKASVTFDSDCISTGTGTDGGVKTLSVNVTNFRSGQSVSRYYKLTNYITAQLGVVFDAQTRFEGGIPYDTETGDCMVYRRWRLIWYDTWLKMKAQGNENHLWDETSDYGFAGNITDFARFHVVCLEDDYYVDGQSYLNGYEVFEHPSTIFGPLYTMPNWWSWEETEEYFNYIPSYAITKDYVNSYITVNAYTDAEDYIIWTGAYDRDDMNSEYRYIDYDGDLK